MSFKLGYQPNDAWIEHSHLPVFQEIVSANGKQRLVAGVPGGDPTIFRRLAALLTPPYFLLYVLHTQRGEGEEGRYQSTELDSGTLQSFLDRFSAYFSSDGRFDLWLYTPDPTATVVWDRHNLIHCYGPHDRFVEAFRALGFHPGIVDISFPHQHYYRAEFDGDAADVLAAFDWIRTSLRPEDIQFSVEKP